MVKTGITLSGLMAMLLYLTLLSPQALALTFTAEVDTREPRLGDTITLTLTIDEQAFISKPDLVPLERDFDILGSSKSNQMRRVNGESSSTTRWTVTLRPKREGSVVIPPITYDGQETKGIALNVTKPGSISNESDNQPIFLKVSVNKDTVYAQEQIIYTLSIYSRTQSRNQALQIPGLQEADIVAHQLGDPRTFTRTENGQSYQVQEYKFVMFPEKSGTHTIPPAEVTVTLPRSGSRGRSDFYDFFGQGQNVRLRSSAITIDVKPKPAEYPNAPWLPAQAVTLSEAWSPETLEFKVGEPITRTITLSALGLPESTLPPLPEQSSKDFKIYPDKAETETYITAGGNGLVSSRIESQAFIPTEPGTTTLPGITVYWWDVRTNSLQTSTIAPKTVTVLPGARQPRVSSPEVPQATEQVITTAAPAPEKMGLHPMWKWAAIGFAVLWLTTLTALIGLWRAGKTSSRESKETRQQDFNKPQLREAKKSLVASCKSGQPTPAKEALITWFARLHPDMPIYSIGDIRNLMVDTNAIDALNDLEDRLYKSEDNEAWDGRRLLDAIENYDVNKEKQAGAKGTPALDPLYPV